ncbi:MAG: hypothetical protein IH912_04200, partial [Proteobacteria bacterium]|nr:hypothetical protein [Pseudomonadota bacterium]
MSFKLTSDPPLNKITEEIEITAALSTPGGNQILILVPEEQQEGDFEIVFLLDIVLYYAILSQSAGEQDTPPQTQLLNITAKVKAQGQGASGDIQETLVHRQAIRLTRDVVQWVESEPQVRSESLTKTVVLVNPAAANFRVISISGAVLMGLAVAITLWNYIQAGRSRPTALELEAFEARQKHGELLVDVATVPEEVANGAVVNFGSLEELFKAAEALFKPVLHRTEPDRHVYFVL